jgi:hypothetical protein
LPRTEDEVDDEEDGDADDEEDGDADDEEDGDADDEVDDEGDDKQMRFVRSPNVPKWEQIGRSIPKKELGVPRMMKIGIFPPIRKSICLAANVLLIFFLQANQKI